MVSRVWRLYRRQEHYFFIMSKMKRPIEISAEIREIISKGFIATQRILNSSI